jgi:hypothetical protein
MVKEPINWGEVLKPAALSSNTFLGRVLINGGPLSMARPRVSGFADWSSTPREKWYYAAKGRLGNTWATLILFEAPQIIVRHALGGCRKPSGGIAGIAP